MADRRKTALAVKLDSKGPIFFKQRRYGFNNELIEIYKFRSIYAEQTDAEATKQALEWAEREGRLNDVAPELLVRQGLTDEVIDAMVAERDQAKKQRNFARADQIRNELAEKGVVLEDSKDGVRWKRK